MYGKVLESRPSCHTELLHQPLLNQGQKIVIRKIDTQQEMLVGALLQPFGQLRRAMSPVTSWAQERRQGRGTNPGPHSCNEAPEVALLSPDPDVNTTSQRDELVEQGEVPVLASELL